ncbi:hypothetical protein [Listeria aquatica]|uniref:hypothetical protein n=1 Tax=Listeria aquatica TaxID=1494960 RepID=UPI0031F569D7
MKKRLIKTIIVTSCMGLTLSVVTPSMLSVKAAVQEEKALQLSNAEKRKLDKAIDSFKKENEGLGLSNLELAQKFVRENSQDKNSVQSRGAVGIGFKGNKVYRLST